MKRRIFKTKVFARDATKMGLTDAMLCEVTRGAGNQDGLGRCLFKARVALPGAGQSGGARTIYATKRDGHWFFLFCYPKNVMDNIGKKAEDALAKTAQVLLLKTDPELDNLVKAGALKEVDCTC